MANSISVRIGCHLSSFKDNLHVPLNDFFDPDIITRTIKKLNIDYRERIFTPFVLIHAMISQLLCDDGSCRQAVLSVIALRIARGQKPCSPNTGAYCQAKSRIPFSFFSTLSKEIGNRATQLENIEKAWKHGKVSVVDGTGISMPDTKNNLRSFHRHTNDKKKVGFSQGRLVGVFSLETGCLLDLVVNDHMGKGTGELSSMQKLWHCLKKGETLMGDALYSNYWIISKALQEGVHVVAEFPKQRLKRINSRLDDQQITIEKPALLRRNAPNEYEGAPDYITARIVKIRCAPHGFRPKVKYILTTHLDKKAIPAGDIADLYRKRWEVEISIRAIKTTLGMDTLKAKSPDMILKEIWGYMLVYNMIRIMMVRAGSVCRVCPKRLSFRATQQIIGMIRLFNLNGVFDEETVNALIIANTVPFRPDRYEPRAQKRRHKNYTFMQETRSKTRKKFYKKYKEKRIGSH